MHRNIHPVFEKVIRLFRVGYRNVLGQWRTCAVYAYCPGSALRCARESVEAGAYHFHLLPSPQPADSGKGVARILSYG